MATRQMTNLAGDQYNNLAVKQWTGLLNGDDGAPFAMPGYPDKSVQVSGVTGTGGTLVIEGTIDGTNWATLTDPQGNLLSFASGTLRIEAIAENVISVRPRVTAGDGTTNFTVTIMGR